MEIILASQSPRRRELLTLMGLDFTVITSDVEEQPPHGAPVAEYVSALALQKAEAVAKDHPNACVIGDATGAANILKAVAEGYRAANSI